MKKIETQNVEFGRRLKTLREKKVILVTELAKSIGVAVSTLSE
jgi:hypothetical protein